MCLHYLGKFKVSDWAVDTIIIGVHLNDWLNSDKRDWQLWFIVSQKVTRITSHHLYYSMWSKCSPPAQTQARRPWCNSTTAHSIIVRLRAAHSLFMSCFQCRINCVADVANATGLRPQGGLQKWKIFSAPSKLDVGHSLPSKNPTRYVALDTIHLPLALMRMIRQRTLALKAWNLPVVFCAQSVVWSSLVA